MSYSKKFLAIGTIAILAVLGLSTPAHADEAPPIAPETLSFLTDKFDELGVAESARQGLLEKYANDVPWDNMSGEEPISTEEYRIGITDYHRMLYPDGSVVLETMEKPDVPTVTGPSGTLSPMAISGCSYIYSAGVASYSNCEIKRDAGTLMMMFHANYWQSAYGAGASLANSWDWDIQAAAGTCALNSLGAVTATQVRIRAYCAITSGIGSNYPYLDLVVTRTSATLGYNWMF